MNIFSDQLMKEASKLKKTYFYQPHSPYFIKSRAHIAICLKDSKSPTDYKNIINNIVIELNNWGR